MKLTKLERHMAYIIMLAEAETNLKQWIGAGICHMSTTLFANIRNDTDPFYAYEYFKELYPELYNSIFAGDRNDNWAYFNNWEERLAALRQCITETEDLWPK